MLMKIWNNYYVVAALTFALGIAALTVVATAKRATTPASMISGEHEVLESSEAQIYVASNKGDLEARSVRTIPISKSPPTPSPPPTPMPMPTATPTLPPAPSPPPTPTPQVANADPSAEAAEPINRHWHERTARHADRGGDICARHGLRRVETGHGGWRCR